MNPTNAITRFQSIEATGLRNGAFTPEPAAWFFYAANGVLTNRPLPAWDGGTTPMSNNREAYRSALLAAYEDAKVEVEALTSFLLPT
jgi:hypothetical protein